MGAVVFGVYGMIFGILTIKHVSYAVVALICMFAFEQWGGLFISAVAANSTYVNLAVLTLVLVSMLRMPPSLLLEFVTYPIRSLYMLLMLYAFLSTSWAPQDANATDLFIGYLHYHVVYLFIAPLLFVRREHFTQVLDALSVLGGVLVVLFAFVPNFEGRGMSTAYDLEETVSLPLALGSFAGVVLLIVLIRATPSLLGLLWALLVSGSALLLITKTGSRGQLVFALLALMVCFPVRWKGLTVNRVLTLVLLALLAVAALIFVLFTENTLSSRIFGGAEGEVDLGTESRTQMIRVVLEVWSNSDLLTLIFGLGSSASWSIDLAHSYPHVVPLEILGELGLLGFTLFSIIVCFLFFQAYTSGMKAKMSNQSAKDYAALFACFVFQLLLASKQGALIYSVELMLFAVLAEKCFRVGTVHKQRRRRRRRLSHPSMLQS